MYKIKVRKEQFENLVSLACFEKILGNAVCIWEQTDYIITHMPETAIKHTVSSSMNLFPCFSKNIFTLIVEHSSNLKLNCIIQNNLTSINGRFSIHFINFSSATITLKHFTSNLYAEVLRFMYHIYSAIRPVFLLSRMTIND